eukprot:m51a1_g4347 hypothetical protein (579) ;mRNA; f:206317-208424
MSGQQEGAVEDWVWEGADGDQKASQAWEDHAALVAQQLCADFGLRADDELLGLRAVADIVRANRLDRDAAANAIADVLESLQQQQKQAGGSALGGPHKSPAAKKKKKKKSEEDEQEQTAKAEEQRAVEFLTGLMPGVDEQDARAALWQAGGDVPSAAAALALEVDDKQLCEAMWGDLVDVPRPAASPGALQPPEPDFDFEVPQRLRKPLQAVCEMLPDLPADVALVLLRQSKGNAERAVQLALAQIDAANGGGSSDGDGGPLPSLASCSAAMWANYAKAVAPRPSPSPPAAATTPPPRSPVWDDEPRRGMDAGERLSLAQLKEAVPACVPEDVVGWVFEACGRSTKAACASLVELFPALRGVQQPSAEAAKSNGARVVLAEAAQERRRRKKPAAKAGSGDPQAPRTLANVEVEPAQERRAAHTTWDREKASARATELSRQRDQLYSRAAAAFVAGDGVLAKELSERGRQVAAQVAALRSHALDAAERDAACMGRGESMLDLHGYNVQQALRALEAFLKEVRARPFKGPHVVNVITGLGTHSKDRTSRLTPAVLRFLETNDYEYSKHNGFFLIRVRGID